MSTLIKADIFFFITAVSVVLITIFIIIALLYIIKVFRQISSISDKLENNIDNVNVHIEEFTEFIKESFLFNLLFIKKKGKKKDK